MSQMPSSEYLGLAAILGFLYGYMLCGTPLLPRHCSRTFLPVAGTSALVFAFSRNIGDPSAPFSRLLPVVLWYVFIVAGLNLRELIEVKFSWPDLFKDEIEALPPDRREKKLV